MDKSYSITGAVYVGNPSASTPYTATSDGYFTVQAQKGTIVVYAVGIPGERTRLITVSPPIVFGTIFVRKGIKIYIDAAEGALPGENSWCSFYPVS